MIRGKFYLPVFVLIFILAFSFSALASGHGQETEVKKGILLVAFGSSIPEAQVSFKNIDKKAKAAFPDLEIRWAYTSDIIRKIMNENGANLLSPASALATMADDGFTDVAVQSLHSIPGEEYSKLLQIAQAFEGMPDGIKRISVGKPLLSSTDDIQAVADILLSNIPKSRKKDEAVLFMGHGTHHPGNVYYAALQHVFSLKDSNVLVATVEGWPELDDVLPQLKARNIKKAYLMPFMSVAGDHARNDMAGDEADSWKSVLNTNGVDTVCILKGTAEFEGVLDVWMAHLKSALRSLK